MKKSLLWRVAATLVTVVMSVGLLSCSGNDGKIVEPDEPTLIGTWTYYFDDGYCTLTFNQNGTGVYSEYDNGRWEEPGETFTYTYSSGVVTFIYGDDVETARVVGLSLTELVLKDFPDRGNCTFIKQGGTKPVPSLVGTWKYTFSSGYVLLTFNQDGTGVYREYTHSRWDEPDPFTYTYSSGVITFFYYDDDDDVETARVVELTSTSLVLKDWPDGGNCTFTKQ